MCLERSGMVDARVRGRPELNHVGPGRHSEV